MEAFGVEGTGFYGAGLARYLRRRTGRVVEVNRPDRAARHRKGKSDPLDAEVAARSVLAGTATAVPKDGDDVVETIRILKLTRDSAVKAQTQATNQIKSVLVPHRPSSVNRSPASGWSRCWSVAPRCAPASRSPLCPPRNTR